MNDEKSRQKEIVNIAHKFGLSLVVQFGSSLEKGGIKHSESDIDIAFLPTNKISLQDKVKIQSELAQLYNVFEDKIDLVDLTKSDSLLVFQIASKSHILHDTDQHQFNQFYLTAVKRRIDEQDIFDLEKTLLGQKIGAR